MLPNASEFLAINANLLKIAFGRAFARETFGIWESSINGVTYNINNYDQDNVFEKDRTSVIDSKHISTIFDVTFK